MVTLKEKLSTAPVLAYDDGESEIELFTDASSKGLGAVLERDEMALADRLSVDG